MVLLQESAFYQFIGAHHHPLNPLNLLNPLNPHTAGVSKAPIANPIFFLFPFMLQ